MPRPSDRSLPSYWRIQELLALSQAHLHEAKRMKADGLFHLAEDKALEAAAEASKALIATGDMFRAAHNAAWKELQGRFIRSAGDEPPMDTPAGGLTGAWYREALPSISSGTVSESRTVPSVPDEVSEADDMIERAEKLVDSISRLLRGVLPLIWHGGMVWPSGSGFGSA